MYQLKPTIGDHRSGREATDRGPSHPCARRATARHATAARQPADFADVNLQGLPVESSSDAVDRLWGKRLARRTTATNSMIPKDLRAASPEAARSLGLDPACQLHRPGPHNSPLPRVRPRRLDATPPASRRHGRIGHRDFAHGSSRKSDACQTGPSQTGPSQTGPSQTGHDAQTRTATDRSWRYL